MKTMQGDMEKHLSKKNDQKVSRPKNTIISLKSNEEFNPNLREEDIKLIEEENEKTNQERKRFSSIHRIKEEE